MDLEILEFPASWANLKNQPLPPKPDSVFEFLKLVNVSREELLRRRPVDKPFTLIDEPEQNTI